MGPPSRYSFIKVLINKNFSQELQISPRFVKLHGEILPVKAKLRIHSGETWNVKLEQTTDKRYFFTRGWNKFVKYAKLEFGEFVMFTLSANSIFDVTVFGINQCDRKFNIMNTHPDEEQDVNVEEAGNIKISKSSLDREIPTNLPKKSKGHLRKKFTIASEKAGDIKKSKSALYMEISLKRHNKSRVHMCKEFAVATGLIERKKAMLEYVPIQSRHIVTLRKKPTKTEMTKGWCSFRRLNGLEYGKLYSFKFEPRKNVIMVKEVVTGKTK